jgi:predicted GH43/DUF377 family glycosyl hydrolase
MKKPPVPPVRYTPKPVLTPQRGCYWADQMVLNPALIADPDSPRLHMLFRASGPWPQKRVPGQPMPYPISLGYAWSDDAGATWTADFSRPALAPRAATRKADLYIRRADGRRVINYANGGLEDPRLTPIGKELYLTVACRPFPPGPYWTGTPTHCCVPDWITAGDEDFAHVRWNQTVSVLFRVRLDALKARDYEAAFAYVTHLTDPAKMDDRDVVLFPEKLLIQGQRRYVMLHRPWEPKFYGHPRLKKPSMYLAAAGKLTDLALPRARHRLLAAPRFGWEEHRVGASFPPLRIAPTEWLVAYHGKTETAGIGYTQSFLILKDNPAGFPAITHRCPDRLLFARQKWELKGKFATPCVFTCGAVVLGDELVMSYGAADTNAGIARMSLSALVAHVRRYGPTGKPRSR